ncbi:hypothetical protein F5880DRAFT_1608937 [Lentinula raphanica]|nr:hypothetical protein F5880DRAFT_1608937 [Lentinula raphanica]
MSIISLIPLQSQLSSQDVLYQWTQSLTYHHFKQLLEKELQIVKREYLHPNLTRQLPVGVGSS